MSKADVIEVEGVVVEKLPNAFFKVELENGHQILAKLQSSKCPELPELHSFPKPNGILCIQQPTGLGKSSETPFPEAADILL